MQSLAAEFFTTKHKATRSLAAEFLFRKWWRFRNLLGKWFVRLLALFLVEGLIGHLAVAFAALGSRHLG